MGANVLLRRHQFTRKMDEWQFGNNKKAKEWKGVDAMGRQRLKVNMTESDFTIRREQVSARELDWRRNMQGDERNMLLSADQAESM
jgi:hypothetical protein